MCFVVTTLHGNIISFKNFKDGTFDDGYGVSLYVTPEGELSTLGNDWDLNDDGWLDLVVINEFKYNL